MSESKQVFNFYQWIYQVLLKVEMIQILAKLRKKAFRTCKINLNGFLLCFIY